MVGVSKAVIGSTGARALRNTRKAAFAPVSMSENGTTKLGDGPAVQTVAAEADVLRSLVLQVQSLPAARDFLQGQELLGDSSSGELRIDPGKVQGLDIGIVQRQKTA